MNDVLINGEHANLLADWVVANRGTILSSVRDVLIRLEVDGSLTWWWGSVGRSVVCSIYCSIDSVIAFRSIETGSLVMGSTVISILLCREDDTRTWCVLNPYSLISGRLWWKTTITITRSGQTVIIVDLLDISSTPLIVLDSRITCSLQSTFARRYEW